MVTVDVKLHQERAEHGLPQPRPVIGGQDVTDTSGGRYEHRNPADEFVNVKGVGVGRVRHLRKPLEPTACIPPAA